MYWKRWFYIATLVYPSGNVLWIRVFLGLEMNQQLSGSLSCRMYDGQLTRYWYIIFIPVESTRILVHSSSTSKNGASRNQSLTFWTSVFVVIRMFLRCRSVSGFAICVRTGDVEPNPGPSDSKSHNDHSSLAGYMANVAGSTNAWSFTRWDHYRTAGNCGHSRTLYVALAQFMLQKEYKSWFAAPPAARNVLGEATRLVGLLCSFVEIKR